MLKNEKRYLKTLKKINEERKGALDHAELSKLQVALCERSGRTSATSVSTLVQPSIAAAMPLRPMPDPSSRQVRPFILARVYSPLRSEFCTRKRPQFMGHDSVGHDCASSAPTKGPRLWGMILWGTIVHDGKRCTGAHIMTALHW